MKKKCHSCGTVDSIHRRDESTSKLVGEMGPKDTDGLMMFFVYCRNCNKINVYKPGWFGNTKFNRIIDTSELILQFEQGELSIDDLKIFGERIVNAFVEDGILKLKQ